MNEEVILYMSFLDTEGKARTVKVSDPLDNLTGPDIKTVMETIKTKDIFTWKIASIEGAKLVTKTVEPMAIQ